MRADSGGEEPDLSGVSGGSPFPEDAAVSVNVDPMARNNERDALDWGESLRVAVTVGGERYLLSDAIVFGAENVT